MILSLLWHDNMHWVIWSPTFWKNKSLSSSKISKIDLEHLENEGDMFFQNNETNLPSNAASHPKRPESSITPLQTPQNSQSSTLFYCL
jgi:hypothetical protein